MSREGSNSKVEVFFLVETEKVGSGNKVEICYLNTEKAVGRLVWGKHVQSIYMGLPT